MARPGQRPYECMRRAWHSDRHQPMRGSLIQEIFRVVNEIHSSATKKNKEWQEKLPLVVLKAEEIMYSKANSEVEYMDLKTLPERANDAIDTIIRRDGSTESGDLLPPCIEAALNLGCVPTRVARGQRNNNSRCYLSSTTQEATELSVPKLEKNMVFDGCHLLHDSGNPIMNSSPLFPPYYIALLTVTGTPNCWAMDSHCPVLRGQSRSRETRNFPPTSHSDVSLLTEKTYFSQQANPSLPIEIYPSSNLGFTYPIYYSRNPMDNSFAFQHPQVSYHDVVVDKPRVPVVLEDGMGFMQNPFGCGNSLDTATAIVPASPKNLTTFEKPADMGDDLSLHLGPPSRPY